MKTLIIASIYDYSGKTMITKSDTLTVVQQVEDIMSKLRIRDERKIHRAIELVNAELDFGLLYKSLELNRIV
jgi:BioD-like phosphotransacetylase family protein